MWLGIFEVPIGFAIVAGIALVIVGRMLHSAKIEGIRWRAFATAFGVALLLGLIDNDALAPIWEAINS